MRAVGFVPIALMLLAGTAVADRKSQALAEMEKAQDALDRGEFDAAVARFTAARALAPESSGPLLGLGLAHARAGRCEDAVPPLEEYLKRKAKNPNPDAVQTLNECRSRLVKPPGRMMVTSDPSGAEVRVDDPNGPVAGVTPFESTGLPDGVHKLFFRRAGHQTQVAEVRIAAGVTASVSVGLTPEPQPEPTPVPSVPPVPSEPPPRPVALPPIEPGRLIVEVGPVDARVTVDGLEVANRTRRFEGPLVPGRYGVLVERDGYRAVSTHFVLRGASVTRTVKLQRVKSGKWLGLAIPFTLVALGTGIGALVTFYAADGAPPGEDFDKNKTANAALQGVFYPSLALAAVGYVLYGVLNRGRISDGPPLKLSVAPVRGGGVAAISLRF